MLIVPLPRTAGVPVAIDPTTMMKIASAAMTPGTDVTEITKMIEEAPTVMIVPMPSTDKKG